MPIHLFPLSRRWHAALVMLVFLPSAGCGLSDKWRSELAQKPMEQEGDQEAAPVVPGSAVGPADPRGEQLPPTTPTGENPAQPSVMPAGAFQPGGGPAAPLSFQPAGGPSPYPPASSFAMTPPAQRTVLQADSDDFDDMVLNANEVVLVDFYADWCGPCKKQAPILEQYARAQGDVRVVKVNTDSAPDWSTRWR